MGKKTSKTSSTSTPWKPAQGDILGAIGTTRDVVNQNQGNLQNLSSQIGGFLPGLGEKAFGDNPLLGAGNSYATDVLGGKYLNANPYLDGMINSTANDVQDRVNSLFSKSGASLGTQHAGVLSKELANAENTMRYGNYAQERQNQQGAASMIPSLYGSQFAGVTPYLAAAQTAGTLPYAGIGNLGSIIGLAGNSGQTTGKQPGGWGTDLLNAAASIGSAAIMASDPKLKTNLVRIGEWDSKGDGLGKWEWNWKSSPNGKKETGVISTEVAALRPWALVPNFRGDGNDGVNYARLGEAA